MPTMPWTMIRAEWASLRRRFRHSPDACQGADATAEICEPPSSSGGTLVELLAGEAGIRYTSAKNADDILVFLSTMVLLHLCEVVP